MVVIPVQPARLRASTTDPALLAEPFRPPFVRKIDEDRTVSWLLALRARRPAGSAFLLPRKVELIALNALANTSAAPRPNSHQPFSRA
jgi:hypothetical protein